MIVLCNKQCPGVLAEKTLLFEILSQKFIELVKLNQLEAALEYAQKGNLY